METAFGVSFLLVGFGIVTFVRLRRAWPISREDVRRGAIALAVTAVLLVGAFALLVARLP